jgi:SAM-dependent methyltransferase
MTEADARQGFKVGGRKGDLFAGAAASYAAYRRPYPSPVVDFLVAQCGLDGRGRLLDVGCGTGQVFQVMAHHFGDVIAIDPDPEMVAYALRAVVDLRLENVEVRQLSAEDIPPDVAPVRAAIFGASFHWTDRPRVADMMHGLLAPGGVLAVLRPGGTAAWEAEVRAAIAHHLGPERRAGGGVYRAGEPHQEVLRRSRFGRAEVANIPVREQFSVEQILGFLASTSYASKAVLGERAAAFEDELRRSLDALAPGGTLDKVVEYEVVIARR